MSYDCLQHNILISAFVFYCFLVLLQSEAIADMDCSFLDATAVEAQPADDESWTARLSGALFGSPPTPSQDKQLQKKKKANKDFEEFKDEVEII